MSTDEVLEVPVVSDGKNQVEKMIHFMDKDARELAPCTKKIIMDILNKTEKAVSFLTKLYRVSPHPNDLLMR